jgi:hypothetical protein
VPDNDTLDAVVPMLFTPDDRVNEDLLGVLARLSLDCYAKGMAKTAGSDFLGDLLRMIENMKRDGKNKRQIASHIWNELVEVER